MTETRHVSLLLWLWLRRDMSHCCFGCNWGEICLIIALVVTEARYVSVLLWLWLRRDMSHYCFGCGLYEICLTIALVVAEARHFSVFLWLWLRRVVTETGNTWKWNYYSVLVYQCFLNISCSHRGCARMLRLRQCRCSTISFSLLPESFFIKNRS